MPLLQTSGNVTADGYGGGVAAVPQYIEDVFSTYLYTGTGSAQTITNGIDLSGEGGLVWIKGRNNSWNNILQDTNRGINSSLCTNNTDGAINPAGVYLTSFNSNGFSIGTNGSVNFNTNTYVSWAFREQAKFYTQGTYTGTGSVQNIAHNLGSVPGFIIVKDTTNNGSAWAIYHTSLGNTKYLQFTTDAAGTSSGYWNNTSPTSTQFTVGTNGNVNQSGATYVYYAFAHNAGGFGLTGTDNVISCGSYTGNSSYTGPIINLGYEPQWVMIKNTTTGGYSWSIYDNMRGVPTGPNDAYLLANTSDAEQGTTSGTNEIDFQATGFQLMSPSYRYNASGDTYIYIAIRRGPMKVPTSGTSVFTPIARTGTGATATVSGVGFPPDLFIGQIRGTAGYWNGAVDRLRGVTKRLVTSQTNAEDTTTDAVTSFTMDGSTLGIDSNGFVNESGKTYIEWNFQRAPSFFDEVCYTGDGAETRTIAHNLTTAPEWIILRKRNSSGYWYTYFNFGSTSCAIAQLEATGAASTSDYSGIFSKMGGAPTSTSFFVTNPAFGETNLSGTTYVAYLFATCAGVSKVGSYTGTGATQTISCGFTGGARFVLVKRTDTTGDWYVWDTARGMVSGTDPSLLLNSAAAEVNANSIYTTTGGFQIVSTAAGINASGGTYIFLAIA